MHASNIREPERSAVFLAALNGIISNPNFFGAIFQQSPQAAVDFASLVVEAAFGDDPAPRGET